MTHIERIPRAEQEVIITAYRNDPYFDFYATDRTYINKLDKYVKDPDSIVECIKDDGCSKTYRIPKNLLTVRRKNRCNNLSDEEKKARAEKMREAKRKKSDK